MHGLIGSTAGGGVALREDMAHRLRHRGNLLEVIDLPGEGFAAVLGTHDRGGLSSEGFGHGASHHTWVGVGFGADAGQVGARTEQIGELWHQGERATREGLGTIDADFAFAHIDPDGSVLLGRDFFGAVPLYYALVDGGVVWATEYKAILAHPGVDASPDLDMVQHLQHAKRLPLGRTLVSAIKAVRPGSVVQITPDGKTETRALFEPLAIDVKIHKEAEACVVLGDAFERAMQRRIADLDTIGIALSGGMDSIALAFVARKLRPEGRIVTITAGADENDPEVATARKVAMLIGSEHHEVFTSPDMVRQHAQELVYAQEDPYSRSETLQLWAVGREAARQGVGVLFSAQGADGLFAGMPKYKLFWLMRVLPMFKGPLHQFLGLTQLGLPPTSPGGKLLAHLKYKGRLPTPPRVIGAKPVTGPVALPDWGREFLNRALAAGFQTGVCQDVQKFERGFAAHGVEYRSPFYDLEFVRTAYTVTDKLKLVRGNDKWIWRRAARRWVPTELCEVPKLPQRMRYDSGFADELDAWFAEAFGPDRPNRGLFERATLDALIRPGGPERGYGDEAAMRIWTAVMTELWAQRFIDARGEPISTAVPEESRAETSLAQTA